MLPQAFVAVGPSCSVISGRSASSTPSQSQALTPIDIRVFPPLVTRSRWSLIFPAPLTRISFRALRYEPQPYV